MTTTPTPARSDQAGLARIRAELPELDRLNSPELQQKVVSVWESFLDASSYDAISSAPAFPGTGDYDLAKHTRQVVQNSIYLAETSREFGQVDCDMEELIAAALVHDASKLVEREGPEGRKTAVGRALLHAQIAGVRCLEMGLSEKVAYLVTWHPYTPPHVHIKPRYVEMVILTWADLAAADTVFFAAGKPTHLEFEKRFFTLE